jgi:anti-sigma factor RsiW
MTMAADRTPPYQTSDDELTAYLDGELGDSERIALEQRIGEDPALRARIDLLAAGARDFAAAYGSLLGGAPSERLQAILQSVQARSAAEASRRGRRRLAAIAAAVVLFIAGGAVGFFLPRVFPDLAPPYETGNWRETVAEYTALYTPETFAAIPSDPALHAEALRVVGEKLGLDLDPSKVALADFDLKGAILFEFKGRPLAQIAYLSAKDGPVAFCIIRNGRPDAPPAYEERDGQRIVYWTKDGRGYLVIGRVPRPELEELAATLSARVS